MISSFTISAELAEVTNQISQALGMESGTISDNQITASSYVNHLSPKEARLNNDKYWAAKTQSPGQWIQVDLLTTTMVNGIITQGSPTNYERIKTLQVAYKQTSGHGLEYIKDEDGSVKVSQANCLLE